MQAICAAWLLTLTLPAQDPHQSVQVDWSRLLFTEPSISALRSEYAAAVNSRDESRILALYTEDALATIPDGTVLHGADTITLRLRNRRPAVVTVAPQRIHADVNVASETGTFTEMLETQENATAVQGIYVTIYSRGGDGRWRIAMEVRTTGSTPSTAVW